ncbi:MAG: type II secretion system F family protein [Clostridiales bacterium]|nr:type II secretion system F family protein [Clostridiales bacterium]
MAKFQYRAKSMSGKIVEGIYEAPEKQYVIDMIKEKSFYPLEIKEISEGKDLKEYELFSKVKTKDLIVFCRQFSGILKAGVTLVQALKMLGEQTENVILTNIIKEVSDDIQKGSGLSQAMAKHGKHFPPILIHMVNAGEISGTLEESLDTVALQFEKQDKLRKKVKGAMTYPMIVLVVAVVVVAFLLTFVVPTFTTIFESSGADLPGITLVLIGLSGFLKNNLVVIILMVVIILASIKIYLNTDEGRYKFDRFKLNMPLIGPVQTKSVSASFARTLTTLMSSGVGVTEAIRITGQVVGNAYVIEKLNIIEQQVSEGKGLYGPVKQSNIFPPLLCNMLMLGEETGNLEDMLSKTANYFEEEVDDATAKLTSMLEPLIILFLAVIVAFIVIAIALPMFELSNVV